MFANLVSKISSASSASESQSAASSQHSSPLLTSVNKPRRNFISTSTHTTPKFPPVQTNKKVTKSTNRTSSHEPVSRVQKPPVRLTTPTKPTASSSTSVKTPSKRGGSDKKKEATTTNCKLISRFNMATFNAMFVEKLKVSSTDFKSSESERSSNNDLAVSENQVAESLFSHQSTATVGTKPTTSAFANRNTDKLQGEF
jgi:hypothetical protein